MNPFKLSSWSWQQTLASSVGEHSHFTWWYFQSISWGRCWRNSPILNLTNLTNLKGHLFHWLQTHLPPHHLLLLHIPAPYCAFFALLLLPPSRLPCLSLHLFSTHQSVPTCSSQLCLMHPYAWTASVAFLHPCSNSQLQRKSSWDYVGLEP